MNLGSGEYLFACNVYTQNIGDDPLDENDWAWILTYPLYRPDRPGTIPVPTVQRNWVSGLLNPSDDALSPASNIYLNPATGPISKSDNEVVVRNWSWGSDEESYNLSSCPTLKNFIWFGFDWLATKMYWRISEASTLATGTWVLSLDTTGPYRKWTVVYPTQGPPLIVGNYSYSISQLDVFCLSTCLKWQMTIEATAFGNTTSRLITGLLPVCNVQDGTYAFPQVDKAVSDMAAINILPFGQFVYNDVLGAGWKMGFHSS